MPLAGRATATGTSRFAERLSARFAVPAEPRPAPALDGAAGSVRNGANGTAPLAGHFRAFGDLQISSVGFGLAIGESTDEVDARYQRAVVAAVAGGCNHFDVAVSYRGQRSETALGRALADLVTRRAMARDEVIVASKAGFIPYPAGEGDAANFIYETLIAPGIAEPDDLAGGIHCMAPNFLSQQIAWSLRNTGLRTVDIYYLQNPETQLPFVDRHTFRRRLQLAFAQLEEEVAAGRIGCYGIATWDAFRLAPVEKTYMSLEVLERLVVEVAGRNHHLRVVQLPVNPGMLEGLTLRNQPVRNSILPVLSAARDLGFTVIASASLAQGQVAHRMADILAEAFPTLATPDQRNLHLVRSLPGITSALFGSTDEAHVTENLAVTAQLPDPAVALRVAHMKGRYTRMAHSMAHNMAELKAVFFDMGDTIVDLGEGRGSYEARVMQRVARVYDALASLGVVLPPQEAFCGALAENSEAQYQAAVAEQIGIDAPTVMRRFLEAQRLSTDDDVVEAAAEAYCRGGPELVAPLRFGAVETLTALKDCGLRLGAISNTIQPGRFLSTNMQRWGLTGLFDVRVYSSDVGVAKPHPKIFLEGLDSLGVAAEDSVYVGDRLIPDVGGAHGVGMKAVLIEVAHRVESHPTIVPDARIEELPELLDVLPTLFKA